jgi:hypothetical protein
MSTQSASPTSRAIRTASAGKGTLIDHGAKRSTPCDGHYREHPAVAQHSGIVERQDVCVSQTASHANFPLEALRGPLECRILPDDFHRHIAPVP